MNNIKRGLVYVFIANIINMIISILTSFILPKYLSVDTYAFIKTYQLYAGMIGVLHLGYVDGMFLKYGGQELAYMDKQDLQLNLTTFRVFQVVITAVCVFAAFEFSGEFVYIAVASVVIPLNMAAYFKSFFQSIGEFKRYSKLMNATTIGTFIANFVLLLIIKTDDYRLYLSFYIVINFAIWGCLEYFFTRTCDMSLYKGKFAWRELLLNIKEGILLMFGNFANTILTSMDRWFVKALLDNMAFAHYSFACSMETMLNVAVTPITVTLYNYFCKQPSKDSVIKVRNSLIVIAVTLVACAFPAKFILEVYLTKYLESCSVLFYLFAAQIFYIVIKSVYVNLYKATHQQKKYFTKLVLVIIIGFGLNVACFKILHTKEAFAIGTLISAFLWLVFSVFDFKEYAMGWRPIAYIIINLVVFLVCGYLANAVIGFCIYCICLLATSYILLKEELVFLVLYGMSMLKFGNRADRGN